MEEIYIETYLERSDGSSWPGDAEDWLNTTYESSNAAVNCSAGPGTFRTRVSYALTAPSGTNPRYTANTIYSPWISVACGVSSAIVGPGAAAKTSAPVTDVATEVASFSR
jgi:hypothetical protein